MKKLLLILFLSNLFLTINSMDKYNPNPNDALIKGAKTNNLEMVKEALAYGGVMHISINNALIDAADCENALRENNCEIIKLLIKNNADVNYHRNSEDLVHRETALICAVIKGKTEVVKLLLEAGANLENGEMALIIAKANNFQEIVKMLKDKGAKETQTVECCSNNQCCTSCVIL